MRSSADETGSCTNPSVLKADLSRLRIAAVDPERRFAGGEVQVMGLILELRRRGHQVDLFSDPASELWRRAAAAGVMCYALPIRNSLDAVAGLRFRSWLNRQQYDVVHFHTSRAHSLAPYARGRARASIVTRRMDYVPNRLFAPWLYNRAVDGIAAISDGVAQALVRGGVARHRIAVIPSGVDCSRFRPPGEEVRVRARASLGLLPDDVAIASIGALVPRKGHRVLVEAMALATARMKALPLRCFIGGAGPLRQSLIEETTARDLQDSIKLPGQIEDPTALLSALDVFVMPSLHEGLGVAALEAMAAGLPIIASAVGGLTEVVNNGRNGILVGSGNPASLSAAILELALDSQKRRAMGVEGRKIALENYTIELMAQRTLELYRTCLAARSSAKEVRLGSFKRRFLNQWRRPLKGH